jgi:hypothetical protein
MIAAALAVTLVLSVAEKVPQVDGSLKCSKQEQTGMSGKMALTALVVTTVLARSITFSLAGKDDMGGKDDMSGDKSFRPEKGGVVVRCSLNRINPANHPEIFGSPAVARSYGFVRFRDGSWHVRPNCRR